MRYKKSPLITLVVALVIILVCWMILGKDNKTNSNETQEKVTTSDNSTEEDINNIIKDAEKYAENKDYNNAIETIESGLAIHPNSQILLSKKEVYVKEKQKAENESQKQDSKKNSNFNHQMSFYGIWCGAYKDQVNAQSVANNYIKKGIDAKVFITTDWSNLSNEKWYVISAGVYQTKDEANAALSSIQNYYSDAYVKYSGQWQGSN